MHKIIFLRHGESEGVQKKILQGHTDFPLTDTGREQIAGLGRYWREKRQTFDRIITSPLKRCKETSEIIAFQLNITETYQEPLWIERDFGKGEGADLSTIKKWYSSRPYPSAFEPIYDTGETEWAVHMRAGKAVEKLLTFPEGDYLIVAHGNIINAALHMILGVFPQGRSLPIKMALSAGHYATLTYCTKTARWSLVSFNTGSCMDN
jgi:2,3-bisphosphoglycerate-dependent phosphoglycerate mutase